MPATRPPMVWLNMAFPVMSLQCRLSIIATWVLRYPLHHIHMAVNTAMSLPTASPLRIMGRISPMDAPAAPRAVTGTAMASGLVNPNSGFNTGLSFAPTQGRNAIPS